ncbi:hypothetical protein IAT38_005518 [Cryptococcus sp. DSM 104549]
MADIPEYADTPIAELDKIYATLTARFESRATLPLAYRLYNLKQLAYLVQDNSQRIQDAVNKDLGKGGFDVVSGDLWPVLNEIDLAVKKVGCWMKDDRRITDALFSMKSMRPRVKKQPKGVALIISTWNFPWQLSLSPLVGAIAAGCPAVIKSSEHAPTSAALLAELLPKYLDPEAYAGVCGGVEQATALLEKQWGHILYTGGAAVGKIVAQAAAKTLTPSTLELGGKSPVIVTSSADLKIAARRMLSLKTMTSGQICVAPDYILCVKDRVDEFVEVCKATLAEFFPPSPSPHSLLQPPQSCQLRNQADVTRQLSFITSAETRGKLVYRGEIDETQRKMGISLVRLNEGAVGETGGLVEEEVFGPVLSIIPVENLDAAIKYVNDRPKPLALYVCAGKRSEFLKVVNETWSGSATWNDFVLATFARNIPFGGIGASGWGAYHGKDGFDTFTHSKAVLEIPYLFEPLMSLRYPPVTALRQKLLTHLLFAGVNFSRPTSVEHEAKKLQRKKVVWRLAVAVVLVGIYLGGKHVGATKGLF